jgi:hypothetical protein
MGYCFATVLRLSDPVTVGVRFHDSASNEFSLHRALRRASSNCEDTQCTISAHSDASSRSRNKIGERKSLEFLTGAYQSAHESRDIGSGAPSACYSLARLTTPL